MIAPAGPDDPATRRKVYAAYRAYFDLAERKRRWNVRDDIPWDQCNGGIDPAVADVVQTFCMVELYLPDYLSKQLPQVRDNRGRAWMLANWGYEESKHSMALEDWLVRSGHRTENQMAQITDGVLEREWQLRYNDPLASVIYTTFQESATKLHYRNRRAVPGPGQGARAGHDRRGGPRPVLPPAGRHLPGGGPGGHPRAVPDGGQH